MRESSPEGKIWYLYLIECNDGSLYAGISTNVEARYAAHCNGKGARYTRAKPPVRLVGYIPCGSKSDALKQEWAIRRLRHDDKIARMQAAVTAAVPDIRSGPDVDGPHCRGLDPADSARSGGSAPSGRKPADGVDP